MDLLIFILKAIISLCLFSLGVYFIYEYFRGDDNHKDRK